MLKRYLLLSFIIIVLFSCSTGIKSKIIKDWKVTKVEKYTNIASEDNTSKEIRSGGSYNFKANGEVQIVSLIGYDIITITVDNEEKQFMIDTLEDKKMILYSISSEKFKFYLENN